MRLLLNCNAKNLQEITEKLEKEIEKIIENEPNYFLKIIYPNKFDFPLLMKESLISKAIEKLIEQKNKFHQVEFIRLIFLSTKTRNNLVKWIDFFQNNHIYFCWETIKEFFFLQYFHENQIYLFFYLWTQTPKTQLIFENTLKKMFYNNAFLEIFRNCEQLQIEFFKIVNENLEAFKKEKMKFSLFFTISYFFFKFESMGAKSLDFYFTYKKCLLCFLPFDFAKNSKILNTISTSIIFLLKNGVKFGKEIDFITKNLSKLINIIKIKKLKFNFLGNMENFFDTNLYINYYITNPNSEIKEKIDKKLNEFQENISQFSNKNSNKNFSVMSCFLAHHDFVEKNNMFLQNLLKEKFNFFLSQKFYLLNSLNEEKVKKNPSCYHNLIEEIIKNSQNNSSMTKEYLLKIFFRLSQLNHFSNNFFLYVSRVFI